ncbi:MAG TPA: glycoside hydrolase family 30 beta sandwich domain-containing protein [Polyangiaceae bacterium]|nr:glycoside hydrolase family 30 beta sandwich domain-containing protein [Polyangiaceae bacterium]
MALAGGALLMACNAILGIDDGYHTVGKGNGGTSGANGGNGATGGSSGTSGSIGNHGGTSGSGNAGNAATGATGQAGDGDAGSGDTTGAAGTGTSGNGGSGASATGGSSATGGTGGTGGSSVGSGGTAGDAGQAGQGGPPEVTNALVTSAISAYWQTTTWTESSNSPTVTVDDTDVLQNWDGFGMAFTEGGADELMALSTTKRNQVLNLLFGADGAHFAWARIPIGANGYALDRYTEDETVGDLALSDFSIERDMNVLIPAIKAAQAVNPALRFWASAWTPPTWMKTNGDFDRGNVKVDASTLQAYADYFVKFIKAYAAAGIPIELVALQADPSVQADYPSCGWSTAGMTAFIADYLGPELEDASVDADVMLGNLSDSTYDPPFVQAVMADTNAKKHVKVLGYQWSMLSAVANDKSYGLPIWQTEHQSGNYPWMASSYVTVAPNDHAYAVESWGLIRQWIAAGVTQYSAWHAMLDKVGRGLDETRQWAQNSLITIDRNASTHYETPAFYVFRHFSQFVDPGAKVIGTSAAANALAFKNPDGSLVAVMYNSGPATTYTVAIGGKNLDFPMPGNGWATLKLVN